ncbi:MAG: phosphoglucosamine mutase [Marinifilaceae bacterium]|jgi:phosphomannomutase|nr:phosphoglucosamine mutase [Marinifilaceae bacterium]
MTLIKSISGIRGTIGGTVDNALTPIDIVKFTSAYASWIINRSSKKNPLVVVGRDARISGPMVNSIVVSTLQAMGVNVVDIDLATTPTTELAVTAEKAQGGIILTASHNPKQWNALKLLNEKGEFISDKDGKDILDIAKNDNYVFAEVDDLGEVTKKDYTDYHINEILKLELVDKEAIKAANFKIAIDAVNSVGGIVIPKLLKELGVNEIIEMYCTPNGEFPHNPEPLPENLKDISNKIKEEKADLGFVVDPDVDRLAIVNEDGSMFGEEYTLVACSEYVLSNKKGNTVSNLSSTRALADVSTIYGGEYNASAVGEVNVVEMMKKTNAVIGGEGNGGIIYPESHYGRDALVGIGLFLSHLAKKKLSATQLRATYPNYHISKNKIQLTAETDVDGILVKMKEKYASEKINDIDGVKIDFAEQWVHLRKSNTEPIIRIYSESKSEEEANKLANKIIEDIKAIM